MRVLVVEDDRDLNRQLVSALTDAAALLGLAAANGFFFAALLGLVRTALSGYWKLRKDAGLTRYSEDDIVTALERTARELIEAHHAAEPASPGLALPAIRTQLAVAARRLATLDRAAADEVARDVVDRLVGDGTLARDGDRLRDAARPAGLPAETLAAMDRLELALSVAAPPSLAAAARDAGCPPAGVRALEATGRLIRLEDDLAWAAGTYRDLVRQALAMAAVAPLSPAAYRDSTGTSRRYVLAILEDLDRRELLRRTEAGHVLGPRTIARLKARAAGTAVAQDATTGDEARA